MQIDHEYIKKIIEGMVVSEKMYLNTKSLCQFVDEKFNWNTNEKFLMHLELMTESCLIESGKKDGQCGIRLSNSGSIDCLLRQFRLTSKGHEYYEIASTPEVWSKFKDGLKNNTIDTIVSVGKDLLKTTLKKKLEEISET